MSQVPERVRAAEVTTRLWTAEEFATSREIWDGLLASSDADPLFMSWDWQWRWWQHHRSALGAELLLVGCYSASQLVALAPFYRHRAVVRYPLHARRMQLMGIAWRNSQAAFSDYLDIIAACEWRERAIEALARWLETAEWDELALCCTRCGSVADALAKRYLPRMARVREVDPLTGWCAPLPQRFSAYLERLAPDVRRRLFNQRHKLDNPVLRYADRANVARDLEVLWRYAQERWGPQTRSAEFEGFYRDIAEFLADRGELRLTRLTTDDGPLSIMFNVVRNKRVYYLQSGFDLARSQGISPGYLHFGYAIEAACAEGAEQFDFLGGVGRRRDYKRDLLTENVPLVTYHVVRGFLARAMYGVYEAVRGFGDKGLSPN